MQKITIVIPYEGAERYTGIWATEEERIDFRREQERACRCTLSFAATELKHYLSLTLTQSEIRFSSKGGEGFQIYLSLTAGECEDDYRLLPCEGGIHIEGNSRRSVLYGAYEFLKMQGWRWYYPDAGGEIAPDKRENLCLPDGPEVFHPSLPFARSFDMSEGYVYTSSAFLMWMIRNRMSVAIAKEPTRALARKLGFISKYGGHIFEQMLAPDKPWDNGTDLYASHPEWYGLPENGKRVREKAMSVQLCVAHDDMFQYLGKELVAKLRQEWKDFDRIDIWGFDTWGSACACEACKKIGNNTDRAAYFLSKLREQVDEAVKDGTLDHQVQLIMCSYEGTYTLQAPTKPTPENLVGTGDSMVFYPINRCYEHCMEETCCINERYQKAIRDWNSSPNRLPMVIGEYYNVSKYEDLPLLFTGSMLKDLPYYQSHGFSGITYMHVPMLHWGIRSLTHLVYTELAWNMKKTEKFTDISPYIADYFNRLYGDYAKRMEQVYSLVERGSRSIASWRAWDQKSILTQLLHWDGGLPQEALDTNGHFKQGITVCGDEVTAGFNKAILLVEEMIQEEKRRLARQYAVEIQVAVNPEEARKLTPNDVILQRLTEILRQLLYGRDVFALTNEVCRYHDSLLQKNEVEEKVSWHKIGELEKRLESYYMPITGYNITSILVNDAMLRSQLRPVLLRCRNQRRLAGKAVD